MIPRDGLQDSPMATVSTEVTIRILHGADRGQVYDRLRVPLTIGREEGNEIQLNDERVSRCHLKIQRDGDRLVLTDLDSTNGTKVNGGQCYLKILRPGDLIAVGRSLLLVGDEQQIADRLRRAGAVDPNVSAGELVVAEHRNGETDACDPAAMTAEADCGDWRLLQQLPAVPDGMTPGQVAQLCEWFEFIQNRLSDVIESARVGNPASDREAEAAPADDPALPRWVRIDPAAWQQLLQLQARLGIVERRITNPH